MKLDLSKPVQTRDGRKARIICLDAHGPNFPVVALVSSDGREVPFQYTEDGSHCRCKSPMDLINVPEEQERKYWVNLYPEEEGESAACHETKEKADKSAFGKRIACVPVTIRFREGDGL